MKYNVFNPSPELSELVQCFWSLESVQGEVPPKDYFLMADGFPEIIFQYNEGFQKYSAQSTRMRFQHSAHARFEVGRKLGLFGVRLYPHAVNQLLNLPASEGINEVFDFPLLFKQDGIDLADQVYNAVDTFHRANYVSAFLKKKAFLRAGDPINFFVRQVIDYSGSVNITAMQRQSGLSLKQFERRFKAISGFPPKFFARIIRFQDSRNKYCSAPSNTLTSHAYACNYYDQAHFTREFKEFSGLAPSQYFKNFYQESDTTENPGCITAIYGKAQQFDGRLRCGWFA